MSQHLDKYMDIRYSHESSRPVGDSVLPGNVAKLIYISKEVGASILTNYTEDGDRNLPRN
jgi:hypothetical protein